MLPEYQSTIEFSVTRKQLVTAGKELNQLVGQLVYTAGHHFLAADGDRELNQLVGQLVYTGSATVGSGIGGDAFYKVT